MATVYRIHPGIGIARLGNSPDSFCIAAEQPAALPIECDQDGNSLPLGAPPGAEMRATRMKDDEGRIRRQAARFSIWAYDDETPGGRPLKLGDPVFGGGNHGKLVDVQWRVHLANKKASWYEFRQLEGEHGYAAEHPRRNPQVTGDQARQHLIIDPGPRVVSLAQRRAQFTAEGGVEYASTFPPPLRPSSVETLGELMTDDQGRLLVLGGHGNAGSYLYDEFGQPRIDHYANNDGWFDDTSDGPVMARLVFYSDEVQQQRFIDVEYPAWVIAAYPDYVPQIPDIVTMDEVVEDLAVRRFAYRTDLYGEVGTYDCPEHVDPTDTAALLAWQAGRLGWNPEYRPWFYRDIWPILWRPEQYFWLTGILSQSNDPHNQTARGTFDPARLGAPPTVDWEKVGRCLRGCLAPEKVADLFVAPLEAVLKGAGAQSGDQETRGVMVAGEASAAEPLLDGLRQAVTAFAASAQPAEGDAPKDGNVLARGFAASAGAPDRAQARATLQEKVAQALDTLGSAAPVDHAHGTAQRTLRAPVYNSAPEDRRPMDRRQRAEIAVQRQLRRLYQGDLHKECFRRCVASHTQDTYGPERQFLFALLREPGEENRFVRGGRATTRVFNLPLMPLLSGDNPITNELTSKFLRLTDLQYYLLAQWAEGKFINELEEGWIAEVDTDDPYAHWPVRGGRDLDQGVLYHVVGGAFCPGGEVGWIMRNPAIWRAPWRVKADPAFCSFTLTAAQANMWRGRIPETDYISYADQQLSQDDDFDTGMQPGDLTKHMAVPWQSDFNECSTQAIDVTYELWNIIDYTNPRNSLLKRQQRMWETLWWPAHRPMQNWEPWTVNPNGSRTYRWLDWARGVTQTNAGDLKMVTEWKRLPFVVRNPNGPDPDHVFIGVERTPR
ncbi:MAG: LodA/GoxA family CTQ-dependent oxidase [Gemmatimonadetes bacterium]|nr:LodA/GoxA family CTQ-dependent oxidase [Gemmatimonadota bacterium]